MLRPYVPHGTKWIGEVKAFLRAADFRRNYDDRGNTRKLLVGVEVQSPYVIAHYQTSPI